MKKIRESLKIKMLVIFLSIIFISFSSLAVIVGINVKSKVTADSESMMVELTKRSAFELSEYLNKYLMLAETLSTSTEVASPDVKLADKFKYLNNYVNTHKLDRFLIADVNGNAENTAGDKLNISDREYFKIALSGNTTVTTPLVDKVTGNTIMVYAAPIIHNGQITGVLAFARDGADLSNKIKDITFRTSGKTCLIDSNGNTIGHYDYERVKSGENIIEISKSKPELKELANSIEKMMDGETGLDTYMFNGSERAISYTHIPGFTWSIGLMVDTDDLYTVVNSVLRVITIFGIITFVIAIAIVYIFSKGLTSRLTNLTTAIRRFSEGDFTGEIPKAELDSTDEIATIYKAISNSQDSIKDIIVSIKETSTTLDTEALSLSKLSEEYLTSCDNIITATKESAQGATGQSEQIMDISNSLDIFDSNLKIIISSIKTINVKINDISTKSTSSNTDMFELVNIIKKLETDFTLFGNKISNMKNSINDITSITDVINSLSEQTNLLALNAAIEASRAGDAGRGFAVVADEIRKLAEESKSSSANISAIVKNVLDETNSIVTGTNTINKTIESQMSETTKAMNSFDEIISLVYGVTEEINNLNTNSSTLVSEQQSIMDNVNNSSAISEELSAATEEIYASSTELSNSSNEIAVTAEHLNSLTETILSKVNNFKID